MYCTEDIEKENYFKLAKSKVLIGKITNLYTMEKKINPRIENKIKKVLKKNKIVRAGVFGSYARGEQNKKSDIDILVEFKGGLFGLIRLERELEKILNIKVDLLTYKGIDPLLKKRILNEEVRII